MHSFLLPYLQVILACAYALQQNLEGAGIATIWHGPYIELAQQVALVAVAYTGFVGITFLISLIASWSYSRGCFLAVVLMWLAPGLVALAGFHPQFMIVSKRYLLGSGDPGVTAGTAWNYVFALWFGWSLVSIIVNLTRSGERAKHAYDHLWYSLGLTAGVFFVMTWNNSNVRADLASAESGFRAATDILLAQTSLLDARCASADDRGHAATLNADFCQWNRLLSSQLYEWRYEPSFEWSYDKEPTLESLLTLGCDPAASAQPCAASRLSDIDRYNVARCADTTATPECRAVPPTLNRDPRLTTSGGLLFQRYALALRPLTPTLSHAWRVASDMAAQSSAHKTDDHDRWLYFLGFAGLAGGKISFASASLFKSSRRSLAADARVGGAVLWRASTAALTRAWRLALTWIKFAAELGLRLRGTTVRLMNSDSESAVEPQPLAGLSVLVVEGDYLIAKELALALRENGANLVGPVSGMARGRDMVSDLAPDCAVLDINLEGRTVFELAELLVQLRIPTIFVTGYDASVVPAHLRQIPVLLKPVDLRALVSCIRQTIATHD